MSESRLHRDTSSKVIGGVCSGLGNYLNIDPVIVRVIFVLLALFGGGGVIIYILLWIFVPEQSLHQYHQAENMGNINEETPSNEQQPQPVMDPNRGSMLAGIILVALGAIFLVDRFIPRIYFEDLWPLLLIAVGILLLRNHFTKENKEENEL